MFTGLSPPEISPVKYRYPWRQMSPSALMIDGGSFFPEMLKAIDDARESVVLVIYMVHPGQCLDRFGNALASAAGRGIEVRVLADAFGGYPAREELEELADRGVILSWFNPPQLWPPRTNLLRDHRKLLVIDGHTGFIGGFCLADEFDPAETDRPWHDIVIRIAGGPARDMLAEFERDWVRYSGTSSGITAAEEIQGGTRARLLRNHPLRRREIRHRVARQARAAKKRLWLCTPYFAPARRLLRELQGAAARGVDVRLLLSGPATDRPLVRSAGWRYYGRLLRAGARIFEYQDRCLHMKAVLADDWLCAGSCNLDHWNMRWNRDANIETADQSLVAALGGLFEDDFASAREITLDDYRERTLTERISQRFSAIIDALVVRNAYRRQLRIFRSQNR